MERAQIHGWPPTLVDVTPNGTPREKQLFRDPKDGMVIDFCRAEEAGSYRVLRITTMRCVA
ncbi:MAG: hypothetical protein IPI00_12520 [Flavobacteriales bacterium]|nr:hypothetical protein [Flavobacteriales bacterium]